MKQISFQKINNTLVPFSPEDKEALSSFKENQILIAKVSGTMKERSLRQLRLFFACCRTVVENTEDPNWNNVDKVKNQVKVKLQFIDMQKSTVVMGQWVPHYRSICFAELKFMDANNFFTQSWPILAKQIGITVDELLGNAEGGM
jgi:hypothetical protein